MRKHNVYFGRLNLNDNIVPYNPTSYFLSSKHLISRISFWKWNSKVFYCGTVKTFFLLRYHLSICENTIIYFWRFNQSSEKPKKRSKNSKLKRNTKSLSPSLYTSGMYKKYHVRIEGGCTFTIKKTRRKNIVKKYA